MISLPLFGKDSITQRSSFIISLISTAAFWLVLLILAVFIQPSEKQPEEKYKTVQIVLSDIPQKKVESENSIVKPEEIATESGAIDSVEIADIPVENEIQSPSPAPVDHTVAEPKVEPVKTVESPKVESPKVETQKIETPKVETKVPESVKTETSPVKTESISQNTQTTTNPIQQKKTFSWDDFDDDEPLQTTSTPKKVSTSNSGVSGTSATTSTEKTTSQTTSSTSTTNSKTDTTTSAATTNKLNDIANATGTSDSGSSSTPAPAAPKNVTTNSNGINLNFTGGGVRKATSSLSIVLSDESKKYIEHSVSIPITITIEPDGTIIRTNIRFASSLVAAQVRSNIIAQISKWTFDPSDEATTATFNFNIIVK